MRHIYSKAKLVVIWLGQNPQNVKDPFEFVNSFDGSGLEMDDPNTLESLQIVNDKNVARWASLASILDRPWFGRVWVIQEVAMATQAQIVWGSHTCNWGALLKLVEWTTSNGLGHWLTGKAHSTIACWSTLKGLDMHETDHRGISDAPILILVWMF